MVGTLLGPEASGLCLLGALLLWSGPLPGSGSWWWVVGGSVLVVSGCPSFVLRRRVLVWGVGGVVV